MLRLGLIINKAVLKFFTKFTVFVVIIAFAIGPIMPVLAQEVPLSPTPAPQDNSSEISPPGYLSGSPAKEPGSIATPVADDDGLNDSNKLEPDPSNEQGTEEEVDTKQIDDQPESDPEEQSSLMGQSDEPQAQPHVAPSTIKQLVPESDQVTGALVYSFPITVALGRNGMQPDLALAYNSGAASEQGSIFGAGWSINIPSIERINRNGTNSLYTDNYFTSSLTGELVNISGSSYGSKVDNGEFMTYNLVGNVWTVKDKKGTVYTFGSTASARQDNPNDSTKIYKWMLEEIRDRNDNYIKYQYTKNLGQIYPSRITYTGNGITDGIFDVEFTIESRSDAQLSYKTGFGVTTGYRVSEIKVEENNTWARKYAISYTSGDNDSRSVINTITESGQDGTVVSIPAFDLDYQANSSVSFTQDTNWSIPVYLSHDNQDMGSRLVDVNGDGLTDIIKLLKSANPTPDVKEIYLNTGSGWSLASGWTIPSSFFFVNHAGASEGGQIADVNGDQLPDLIIGIPSPDTKKVYLHTGTGWVEDTNWVLPIYLNNSTISEDSGVRLFDANGDGLTDIIKIRKEFGAGPHTYQVYLNNGSGWTQNTSWTFPTDIFFANYGGLYEGGTYADVNGDGLIDLLQRFSVPAINKVYLNTGTGWSYNSAWSVPVDLTNNHKDLGVRMIEVNGDGLVDFMKLTNSSTPVQQVYINNGTTGWSPDNSWTVPSTLFFGNTNGMDEGGRVADVNGDGIIDLLRKHANTPSNHVYFSNAKRADLASRLTYPEAGYTDVTYKGSAQYVNGSTLLNPNLPLVLDTVYQLSHYDGIGVTSTSTFKYEGGRYYFNNCFDRKYAGFHKVTRTNSAGDNSIVYYHQGDTTNSSQGEYSDHIAKSGKAYRTEVVSSSGNVYHKTINKWEHYNLGTGRDFVKLTQKIDMTYDGDSDHKDKAAAFTHSNTNGNLTQSVNWGEVTGSDNGTFTDMGTDRFTTDITYASNTTYNILGLPSQETTINQSSGKVNESKYYYDTLSLNSVDKGNLTKHEQWKTGSTYIDTEKTYNSYGLVTQEKDPRDKATNYTYDTYNLYPATVTNALSQATQYVYDYSIGKPKQVTDVNGFIYQTVFDGMDRVVEEKQPNLTTPTILVTKATYAYTYLTVGLKIQKNEYLDSTNNVATYTYSDGLGRLIQTRTEAEDSNTYAVSDIVYNNLEQIQKESLPYSSTGSDKTSPTATTSLYSTYTYDPMMRVASVVNAVGTTTNAHDDWKLTVTDPRGKSKSLYKDANGNLVKVEEFDNSSAYTTNYEYNGLNNLTKITDANGNVRNFTYDGLGRRLTAQDLHASADATFGSWTYTYDDAGNLTSSLDPKNQTINYTYDNINRQLTEDYTGQGGTETTYAYDSCTNGVGKLCTGTNTGANEAKEYNSLGLIKRDTKTINSTNYISEYTYDRQGNQITLKNPDNSEVKNNYNTAGQLETVQRKESTDGSYINVVTDFDYGPHGKITYQAYTNGSATNSTYDVTKLYRLGTKITTITGGTKVQDLAYTYDVNGNITKIIDNSQTNSKKTVDYIYDDLNRLISSATTNAVNGQNYYQGYAYDKIGNITYKSDQGTYKYEGNQGSNYANPHAVTSVKNESNGNEIFTGPMFMSGNNGSDEKSQSVAANVLSGKQSITITYNLHGLCALGGDASAVVFEQNGWKYVSLSNYGTNCLDGVQTVTIPLSDFTGLNPSQNLTGSFRSRFWYSSAFKVDILSVRLNTGTTAVTSAATFTYDANGNQTSSGVLPAWYATGGTWTDRKQITIDESKVPGSNNLTDFPVLFSVTDPELKTVANGGKVGKSDGTDILFASSDGTTKLNHEIEKYVATTGELVAWIKVPTLNATVNTKLLVYYGNASAADQQNKTGTWNSNYKGVWHLNNSLNDSTSNAKNLTNNSSTNTTSGSIGDARLFNGTSQSAYTASLPTTVTNNFTLSVWVNPATTPGSWQSLISNGSDSGSSGGGWAMFSDTTWKINYNMVANHNTNSSVTASEWNLMTIIRNGGVAAMYKNGVQIGTTTSASPSTPVNIFSLGAQAQNTTPTFHRYFNGKLDEVRVLDTVRSADWIAAEYNNQYSPSTFYSYGSVQADNMFSWDYSNRMVQSLVGSVTDTYAYDSVGQRVKLSNGTTTTYYPSKSYNIEGSNRIKHIFAGDQMVATVKGTGASAIIYMDHTDHLTGSNVITNSSGAMEQLLDYYPYGSIRLNEKAGTFDEQRKYAGHEYDVDTQLSYMNARYYDAARGRFTSQDPVFLAIGNNGEVKSITDQDLQQILADPQNLNSYAYGRNNPLSYQDPTGQWSINIFGFLPQSTQVSIGDGANYLYNNNSAWRAAMDNPAAAGLVVGAGSAAVAYAGAAGLTSLSANYLGGAGTACIAFCGPASQGFKSAADYTANYGTSLGSKMNQVASNLEGQPYNFSTHSIRRIAEKVGVGNEGQVLKTLKQQPFNYSQEGVKKLGYIDNATKTFVGQVKDATKTITTVITNIGKNYKNNLINKSK